MAEALRDYGAYVVDNSGWDHVSTFSVEKSGKETVPDSNCLPFPQSGTANGCTFFTDMQKVISLLQIVDSNTSSTPGGGSIGTTRLALYAPAFSDGTGGPPAQ